MLVSHFHLERTVCKVLYGMVFKMHFMENISSFSSENEVHVMHHLQLANIQGDNALQILCFKITDEEYVLLVIIT